MQAYYDVKLYLYKIKPHTICYVSSTKQIYIIVAHIIS